MRRNNENKSDYELLCEEYFALFTEKKTTMWQIKVCKDEINAHE